MLGLQLPTDPRWATLVEESIQDILTDHAYCEQKAASQCISLIVLYPDKKLLVEKLSPIVTEEWGHFRMVLKELEKRSLELGWPRKDEYVTQLSSFMNKGGRRHEVLLEKLLVCALIEARSCERFRLLSENIKDDELKDFYRQLMISEAGHYRLFLDLAKEFAPEEKVKQRWAEYLKHEAEIMQALKLRGDRIH